MLFIVTDKVIFAVGCRRARLTLQTRIVVTYAFTRVAAETIVTRHIIIASLSELSRTSAFTPKAGEVRFTMLVREASSSNLLRS
jgi:hypothetical protein